MQITFIKLTIKLCLDVSQSFLLSPLAIFNTNKIQSNIIPLYDIRIWETKFAAKLRSVNKRKRKLEREVAGHTDLNFFHYNLDASYNIHY